MNLFSPYAKAYAALIGSVCTALLAVFAADSTVGQVLTAASIVATTFVTFQVKNAPEQTRDEAGAVNLDTGLLIVILLGVVLLLFGQRFG